jgi:hypothetical protein
MMSLDLVLNFWEFFRNLAVAVSSPRGIGDDRSMRRMMQMPVLSDFPTHALK